MIEICLSKNADSYIVCPQNQVMHLRFLQMYVLLEFQYGLLKTIFCWSPPSASPMHTEKFGQTISY